MAATEADIGKLIKSMNQVKVKVCGFDQIFDKKIPTIIPDYQRSYSWGEKKAEELLNDFNDFFIKNQDKGNYYLGSILLYNNNNEKFEIIDGQQRITTLLIIKFLLYGRLPENQNIEFNTHLSKFYIIEARHFFEKNEPILKKLNDCNFLNRIEFTKIITHSEDDAFTFFDTQNNRGIKLSATDFLKAYHLRAIKSQPLLQEKNALYWESIGYKNTLDYLFEKILWRIRNWKGRKIDYENKDLILDTFQKKTLKSDEELSYLLYPSANNIRFQKMNWNDDRFDFFSESIDINSPLTFPFCLRQPIQEGINFFDYTAKYNQIYELLFELPAAKDDPIDKMRSYYNAVYTNDMSQYLKDFLKLLLVTFYDTFGKEQLYAAINHFDYVLGSLRLEKQQIRKEAVKIYLRDEPINIIDFITTSYLPNEVFEFIQNQKNLAEPYKKDIELGVGVQGRYLERVLKKFDKDSSQTEERILWLK